MNEQDIALIVEIVQAVAGGLLYDNDVSGMMECHFCDATSRLPGNFDYEPDCLVVRARQVEGAIEAKLRGG